MGESLVGESFSELLHLVLRCDNEAPSAVRERLDEIAAIEAIRLRAKLVASELVSNAVRHSACEPTDEIVVRVSLSTHLFEIWVRDPGWSDNTPEVQEAPDIGGLGLAIVDREAYRWGSVRSEGRVVWAQLTLN